MLDRHLFQISQNSSCMVCGQPAHLLQGSTPVCLRAQCRYVLNKKKTMDKKGYEFFFKLQSQQIKQTVEYVTVTRKRIEEKKQTEKRENLAFWTGIVQDQLGLSLSEYPFAVIPTNSGQIQPLDRDRRQVYQTHVSELIREVVSKVKAGDKDFYDTETEKEGGSPAHPRETAFQIKACAICKGGCCCMGGDHAFLKPETLFKYMDQHPQKSPDQVLDVYMDRLPQKSFMDSCVNHTESGCSLPRDMRSHICNAYLCDGLTTIRDMFLGKPHPKGFLFIRRAQDNWKKDDINLNNPILSHELVLADG